MIHCQYCTSDNVTVNYDRVKCYNCDLNSDIE